MFVVVVAVNALSARAVASLRGDHNWQHASRGQQV